ncbi:hypothetical protein B1A_00150 [mine drainage metagenome]|uniref:GIY-YIG domain-containing protein n=1 Tax=mine drainage metagenome TaxID=410659 RepID=T1CH00_9ZZZZ
MQWSSPVLVHCSVDYSEFNEFVFPRHGDIVYVIGFKRDRATAFIPFYVGESTRSVGRFGDYIASKLTASTDFKVGQAIQYLHECGCEVVVRYKDSLDRIADERALIRSIKNNGHKLLNDLGGYNYIEASHAEERERVVQFIRTEVLKLSKVSEIGPGE